MVKWLRMPKACMLQSFAQQAIESLKGHAKGYIRGLPKAGTTHSPVEIRTALVLTRTPEVRILIGTPILAERMPSHFVRPTFTRLFSPVRRRFRDLRHLLTERLPEQKRNLRRAAVGAVIFLFGAVAAFALAPLSPDARDVAVRRVSEELAIPSSALQQAALETAGQQYLHEERIRRGDTLALVLNRMQVSDPEAEQFLRANAAARAFYQLRPGRLIEARTDAGGALVWMRYSKTSPSNRLEDDLQSHALVLERDGATFRVHDLVADDDRHLEMRSGTIQNSLFAATDALGIPESVASQMIDIFAGDIDFYRDVQRGDQFRVIYEMFDQNGELARAGRILAVEFVSGPHTHQAVWYQTDSTHGGYYGFAGQSLRRAFLRAPLVFSRISSGFGGRVHPILNIWRWHTGIDYAAPMGTPVRATGDGTVVSVGQETGYGNAILIQHQGVYSTLYGHLSAFARGLRRGLPVSQGQLIGYVGMTGWATGPHLHYEFRINGVAKDPLRVALPDALPIERNQFAAFQSATRDLDREIDLLRSIDLARSDATVDRKGGSGAL